ncbi:helix-turn-helix domain-containing protein [Vibrio campbellii]|uniref:HTH domain-containing protein n=1 Tax=Vibrio campbellii TaxID=680 RepID=UPI0005ED819C|nr:HTH domain-containing protein [Vibrio campbellii]
MHIQNTNQLVGAINALPLSFFKSNTGASATITKLVAIELAQAFNLKQQLVVHVRSQEKLADKLEVSRHTVMRAVRALKALNVFQPTKTLRGFIYAVGSVLTQSVASLIKPKQNAQPEATEQPLDASQTATAKQEESQPESRTEPSETAIDPTPMGFTQPNELIAVVADLIGQGAPFEAVVPPLQKHYDDDVVNLILSKANDLLERVSSTAKTI